MGSKRQTHVRPRFSPVPGPTASGPHFAVLVGGGAALHLHLTPRKGSDFRGRHLYAEPKSGKKDI